LLERFAGNETNRGQVMDLGFELVERGTT